MQKTAIPHARATFTKQNTVQYTTSVHKYNKPISSVSDRMNFNCCYIEVENFKINSYYVQYSITDYRQNTTNTISYHPSVTTNQPFERRAGRLMYYSYNL